MDQNKIREALTSLLNDIAAQARVDATNGQSNIGSIYDSATPEFRTLDEKQIQAAIVDINKATATKDMARRLVNAIMLAASTVANITKPA